LAEQRVQQLGRRAEALVDLAHADEDAPAISAEQTIVMTYFPITPAP
jgi:hypothetical protein